VRDFALDSKPKKYSLSHAQQMYPGNVKTCAKVRHATLHTNNENGAALCTQ